MIRKLIHSFLITLIIVVSTIPATHCVVASWDPQLRARKIAGQVSTMSLMQSLKFAYDLLKQCDAEFETTSVLQRFAQVREQFKQAYQPLIALKNEEEPWLGFLNLDPVQTRQSITSFGLFLNEFIKENRQRLTFKETLFIEKICAVDLLYTSVLFPSRETLWEKAGAAAQWAKEFLKKRPFLVGIPAVLLSYYLVKRALIPAPKEPEKPHEEEPQPLFYGPHLPNVIPPTIPTIPPTLPASGIPPLVQAPVGVKLDVPAVVAVPAGEPQSSNPEGTKPPEPPPSSQEDFEWDFDEEPSKPFGPEEEPYDSTKEVVSYDGLVTHVPSFSQVGLECSYAACYVASSLYFEQMKEQKPLFDRMKRDEDHFFKWKNPIVVEVKKSRIEQLITTWKSKISIDDLSAVDQKLLTLLDFIKNPEKLKDKSLEPWLAALKNHIEGLDFQGGHLTIDSLIDKEGGKEARAQVLESDLFGFKVKKHLVFNEDSLARWMSKENTNVCAPLYQDLLQPQNAELRKSFVEKNAKGYRIKSYILVDQEKMVIPDALILEWIKDPSNSSLVSSLTQEDRSTSSKRLVDPSESDLRKGYWDKKYKGIAIKDIIGAQELNTPIPDEIVLDWVLNNKREIEREFDGAGSLSSFKAKHKTTFEKLVGSDDDARKLRAELIDQKLGDISIRVLALQKAGTLPSNNNPANDERLLAWFNANPSAVSFLVNVESLVGLYTQPNKRQALLSKMYDGISVRAHIAKDKKLTILPDVDQVPLDDAQVIEWLKANRTLSFDAIGQFLNSKESILIRHERLGKEVDGIKIGDQFLFSDWDSDNSVLKELGHDVTGSIIEHKKDIFKVHGLAEWLQSPYLAASKTWKDHMILQADVNEANADEIQHQMLPSLIELGIPKEDITIIGGSRNLERGGLQLYPQICIDVNQHISEKITRLQKLKKPQVVILNLYGAHWIPAVLINDDGTIKVHTADTAGGDKRHNEVVRNLLSLFSMKDVPEACMIQQFDDLVGTIRSVLEVNRLESAIIHLNRAIIYGLRGYRNRTETRDGVRFVKDENARSFFQDKEASFKTYYEWLVKDYTTLRDAILKKNQSTVPLAPQMVQSEVPVDPYKYSQEKGDKFLSIPIDFNQCPDLDSYVEQLRKNPEFNALI